MSGDERLEEATGTVNGFNLDFTTASPYEPGSIYVLFNGQLWPQDDDESLVETNPATGEFRMKVAPQNDDRVLVRYIEA